MRWYFSPGDPNRSAINADPYPFYDRMRCVRLYQVDGIWFATGYNEVNELLRNPAWHRELTVSEDKRRIFDRVFLNSFGFLDEPDHTRLRRVVAPVFTRREIELRRERIREIVRELLDGLRDRDSFEFINDFAGVVPTYVVGDMLGISPKFNADLIRWSKARDAVAILARIFESSESHGGTPQSAAEMDALDRAALECEEFFQAQIDHREQHPGNDLISLMLADSHDDQPRINDQEIINMCLLLHLGGHSTTANQITNGLALLSRFPQCYSDIQDDPSLIPSAVEEMLRYETPARSSVHRIAPDQLPIGGYAIPEVRIVYAMLGAANRDPAVFPDPHRFDIRRDNNRHLSFAAGTRFCIGAYLARMELQETFRILITEYPRLTFDVENLRWRDSFVFRALESLPVRWSDRN